MIRATWRKSAIGYSADIKAGVAALGFRKLNQNGRTTPLPKFNPDDDWSLQASYGRLNDAEELRPGEDVSRLTASASNNWPALNPAL